MAGEPEQVELVRTGGFANLRVVAGLPVASLSAAERAGVDSLVRRAPGDGAQPGAPDRFAYEVTVVVAGYRHAVRLGEYDVDDELRPLIDRLVRDATPVARRPQ